MNNLTIFESPEFGSIRTVEEDGKVLFCAKDVAAALGYKNTSDAINRHCKGVVKRDGVSRTTNQHGVTTEQTVEMAFIPEGDVYRLAAKSELPGAERFESWIFDEVIPSIRRSGGYIAGQKELSPEELMARALKVANDVLAAREARISELTVQNTIMAPKADYFDELVDRNLLTSFRDTAKQLGVSQNAFIGFLKELLIAAIGAAVTGLGVWCLMAILERSGPDEGRTPQADLTGGKAKQNITHNLPVAIDLPLPVGEINVSTQKQLSGRPVTEVYFALYKDDMDQLEQSELWQQFCQAFAAVQSREREKEK